MSTVRPLSSPYIVARRSIQLNGIASVPRFAKTPVPCNYRRKTVKNLLAVNVRLPAVVLAFLENNLSQNTFVEQVDDEPTCGEAVVMRGKDRHDFVEKSC